MRIYDKVGIEYIMGRNGVTSIAKREHLFMEGAHVIQRDGDVYVMSIAGYGGRQGNERSKLTWKHLTRNDLIVSGVNGVQVRNKRHEE